MHPSRSIILMIFFSFTVSLTPTDNQLIATYIVEQLELKWTNDGGVEYEFMVFVNEDTGKMKLA